MKGLPGLASLIACSICSSSRQRALNPARGWLQRHMAACNTTAHVVLLSDRLCCTAPKNTDLLVLSVLLSVPLNTYYSNGHTEMLLEYFSKQDIWESSENSEAKELCCKLHCHVLKPAMLHPMTSSPDATVSHVFYLASTVQTILIHNFVRQCYRSMLRTALSML